MCALFYENRLGIKKSVISFVFLFCPNTGTKFREPYYSNHVIPHREIVSCKSTFLNQWNEMQKINPAVPFQVLN